MSAQQRAMSVTEQAKAVEYLRRFMAQHKHDWNDDRKGCRLCDEVDDFINQTMPGNVQQESEWTARVNAAFVRLEGTEREYARVHRLNEALRPDGNGAPVSSGSEEGEG